VCVNPHAPPRQSCMAIKCRLGHEQQPPSCLQRVDDIKEKERNFTAACDAWHQNAVQPPEPQQQKLADKGAVVGSPRIDMCCMLTLSMA